jgi:hypothetical protein
MQLNVSIVFSKHLKMLRIVCVSVYIHGNKIKRINSLFRSYKIVNFFLVLLKPVCAFFFFFFFWKKNRFGKVKIKCFRDVYILSCKV